VVVSLVPPSAIARALRLQRGAAVAPERPEPDARFPHLLVDEGERKPEHRRTRPGARIGEPNARWSAGDLLPPSVGPRERRERATAVLTADGPEARKAALARSLRGGAPPDTQRVLVLRIDFLEDTPGGRTTGDGRFDLRDSTGIVFDPPPHDRRYFERHMEALRRYYDIALNGTIALEFDVYPAENDSAYHLPDTFPYGPWIFSNNNPDVLQHAIDLVGDGLAAAERTDPAVDFARYDHFILFHAGADFQGDVNRDTPWDIPSFNLFVVDPFAISSWWCPRPSRRTTSSARSTAS
jgi:hypothetical protein